MINMNPLLAAGLAVLLGHGLPDHALASTLPTPSSGNGLSLSLGLTPFTGDPQECGTETELEVNVADQVNVCYTMTNGGSETLYFQSLTDSVDGPLLIFEPITLAPGESHIHVRTVVADGDVTREASWTGFVSVARYDYDDSVTPDFVDISTTGTDLGFVPGDGQFGLVAPITTDFPVRYYELESNTICATMDGMLLYDDVECRQPQGSGVSQGYYANQDMPTDWWAGSMEGMPVLTYLAPMWQGMDDAGRMYYQVLGEAPDRRLVVQWDEILTYIPATTPITFQVVMHENGQTIRFEYQNTDLGNVASHGAYATIGLHADPHGLYTKYSYYEASLTPYSAIEWTYSPPESVSTSGNAVRIDAGVPRIAAGPDTLTAVAMPGDLVTHNLTIDNIGDRDLHWQIHASGHAAASPSVPLGGPFQVPAYGNSTIAGLVHLDAADPETHYYPVGGNGDWFYATSFLNNDFSKLYGVIADSWDYHAGDYGTIDLETGLFNHRGRLRGGFAPYWTGLTQDPTTGTVYALNMGYEGGARLYIVDLETGLVTLVGEVTGAGVHPAGIIPGMAISPQGRMYALDLLGQQLLEVDKTTGQATVVGSLGLNLQFYQDLEFDQETGDLYWSSMYATSGGDLVGEMRVLYTDDASSRPLGVFPPAGGLPTTQLATLAIAKPAAGCLAPTDIPWLSLSHDNGMISAGDPGQEITVTLDATGLEAGLHKAAICIFSDDPLQPGVAVTVTFAISSDPLYDQIVSDTDLHAFNNTVVLPEVVTDMSSEGADDFVINDPDGWQVAGFWFSAYGNADNPPPSHVNLRVHADDEGQPGAGIMCVAPRLEAVYLPEPDNRIGVWLPGGCELPQGHYWVTWSFADVNIASPIIGLWGQITEQNQQPAVWRNPGGMLSADCTQWSTFDQCPDQFDESARDFGFSVFGTVRTGPLCDRIFGDAFSTGSGGGCDE